ncbi:cytochrome P450 [Streptomyces sp. NPDC049577]|uniref:cytochrome P450 n=1 Tax=Streptomyces sp. NPDC049577 TaxID=3155153 RepID=UPI00344280C5
MFLHARQRLVWGGPDSRCRARKLVLGYEEARRLLTDSHRLLAAEYLAKGPASAMSIAQVDPPEHTRLRAVVNHAFAARSIRAYQARVEGRARRLAAGLRAGDQPFDAVSGFCVPYAFGVHCDVMGVPGRFRPQLYRWSWARAADPLAGLAEIRQAELELHRGVGDVLDNLRHHPSDGVLTALLDTHEQGGLTQRELKGLAASLFFDGAHLAAAQLATALLCLLLHPAQLAPLRTGQLLPTAAVEEVLRYSPSITLGMARSSLSPAGLPAFVAFGPANRDPAAFGAPDRFDVARSPNRHLSFGRGIHHCLGAELARLELATALRVLLCERAGLRLAADPGTLAWTASPTIRTLDALPLTWY